MSDLSLHYKVLKQFLDISDDTPRSKTSSSRATRAREKLLKLSPAQFKELSTDVYDELRRRIDESRGEPDYLLPKSSFHPKRNQARQKLSSLPQSRFKDLVSDISYEIERRDLDQPEQAPAQSNEGEHEQEHEQEHRSLDHSKILNPDESQKSMVSDVQNQSIGLQSKTVVPTKANMDWSSDEEPEDDVTEKAEQARAVNADIPNGSAKEIGESSELLKEKLAALEAEKKQLEEKYRLLNEDYEYSTRQSKQLSNEVEDLSEQKSQWSAQKQELESSLQEYQSRVKQLESAKEKSLGNSDLFKELESLKTANAALRLENQSIKRMSARSDVSSPSKNRDISFGNHSVHGTNTNVKKDLEAILEKLEQPVKVPKASSVSTLKSESEYWQKKYESLRADQVSSLLSKSMSNPELNHFYAPSGLILASSISKFYAQLESLITAVDKEALEPDLYFEMVSQLAITANKIATDGDDHLLNSNEQSIFLRESISYCLTTARYHAVYSTLFPKVVIERALGELSFAVCDLLAVCKIKSDAVPNRKEADAGSKKDEINSGVRPLRMANKLKEIQIGKPRESEVPERSSSLTLGHVPDGLQNGTRKLSGLNDNSRSPLSPQTTRQPVTSRNIPASPISNNLSNHSTPTRAKNILDRVRMFSSPPDQSNGKDSSSKESYVKDSYAKDLNVEESRAKNQLNVKDSNVRDSNATDSNARDLNAKDSYAKDSNAKELNTKDSNAKDLNVGELNTNDSNMEKTNARETNLKNLNAKDSNIDITNAREIDSKNLNVEESNANESISKARHSKESFDAASGQADIDDLNAEPEEPIGTTISTTATTVGAPKGKGIFQSLHERLNTEPSNTELKDAPVPSKEKGMFLSIRDRFVPAEGTSDQTVKLEEAPKKITIPVAVDLKEEPRALPVDEAEATNGSTKEDIRRKNVESADSTMIEQPTQASLMNMHKQAVNIVPVEQPREDKPKRVNYSNTVETIEHPPAQQGSEEEYTEEEDSEDEDSKQARERQEYRKSMAAATFNVDLFDIDDPDNTLTQVLLYLEHQTVQVISTIQSLLSAIKKPNATRGELREKSQAITEVISQMTEATNTSMNQTRNAQLKEHGKWVVTSLEDCNHRMNILCRPNSDKADSNFADKNFKQRLAGISFDIAKCTKELVKSVEEASLREEIANLNARISQSEIEV